MTNRINHGLVKKGPPTHQKRCGISAADRVKISPKALSAACRIFWKERGITQPPTSSVERGWTQYN